MILISEPLAFSPLTLALSPLRGEGIGGAGLKERPGFIQGQMLEISFYWLRELG
jgi:hypothetical protein